MKPVRIQIVCADNLARSAMAEVVLRAAVAASPVADRTEITSAGLLVLQPGRDMDPMARQVLEAAGLAPTRHETTQFELDDLLEHDLVVFTESRHVDLVASSGPPRGWRDRVSLLLDFDPVATALRDTDLSDPRGGDQVAYARCLKSIRTATPRLVRRIEQLTG